MVLKPSTSARSKRRIALSLFIAALLIINVVVVGLIFLDIRVIESPEVKVELDLIEINSNEVRIQTTLSIKNPNQFDLILEDIGISAVTDDDDEILDMTLSGGMISSKKTKTFTSNDAIIFNGDIPPSLTMYVTGIVGVEFFGLIQKTLPLKMEVIASFGDIIDSIAVPVFSLTGDFGDITTEGIGFSADISIENPNTFDLLIDDISLELDTETGERIDEITITGDVITAGSATTLQASGLIPFSILNAEKLLVSLSTSVGIIIAGISKSIDFSTVVDLAIPHLRDIFTPDAPTVAFIDADMKYTRQGFLSWGFTSFMVLEIRNPNPIGLVAKDVVFSILRVDDGQHTLLGDCRVNQTNVDPENSTFIPAEIYLPINSLLRGNRLILPQLPDGLLVFVEANLTIPGVDDTVWIGVSGYQDLHLFT